MQFYFAALKNIWLYSRPNFIIKILNKWEVQQIAFNYSSYISYENFMNLYKKWTAKPHYFLVIDTTLASDNPLQSKQNLLERI